MNTSSMNSHENGKLHIRKITWLKSGNLSWHVTGMDLLEPHLPGRKGLWGGLARDNCQFINVVFWILRTGTSWRDFPPPCYGGWSNTHRRFIRWRDKGVWELLLEKLVNNPSFEWLMIDASHIKAYPHAARANGGNQDMERTKGGSTARYIWPWMQLVIRSEYLLHQVPQLTAYKLIT